MNPKWRPGTKEWRELKACGLSAKDIHELDAAIDGIVDRWFNRKMAFSRRVEEVQHQEAAERDTRVRRILEGRARLGRNQRAWLREMARSGGRWLYDPAVRGNWKQHSLCGSLMRLGMVSGRWLGYGRWEYALTSGGRRYLRRFVRQPASR